MNYKLSNKILEEINKAQRILINCHRNPDPDSVGSALALYQVLSSYGKDVKIISPTNILKNIRFLDCFEIIQTVKFDKYDFSKHDLFITLDSGDWNMASGDGEGSKPDIKIINIDHHETNTNYGNINLVEKTASSCAEVLYNLFSDWGFVIKPGMKYPGIAEALLCGIISDTGTFQFNNADRGTFEAALNLMEIADKNKIVFNLFQNMDLNLLRFWGEVLKLLKIEKDGNFVWAAIPYKVYEKYGKPAEGKETAAGNFLSIVGGSDFGILMVETEENSLSISFRSRTGFDVSEVAKKLGGGGHIMAAGASLKGYPFDQSVEKVLNIAGKHAKRN
ncbi:MAG: bifunctional oligoribonuclease/PAP phosphatase NrnA [bacterium]|nr:bifunctional oligoribonuclease/PAP phosphatase NrnA [bacterium]